LAPPVWTNSQIVSNLLRANLQWWGATISYGFPVTAAGRQLGGEADGFSAFNSDQKAAGRLAIRLWDDLMNPDFVETSSSPKITLQNTTTDIYYAHAYFPGSWGAAGSVWTNPLYNSGTSNLLHPVVGQWGFNAIIHEIGHALGLEHPGDYSGNVSYQTHAWYRQDSLMYTVMSYFDASETGADWVAGNGRLYSPQTPMLHDVLAIQSLYGAERATRTGDTIYGFNSNANRSVFDFEANRHPVLCIWDGRGYDTLDFSGFRDPVRMDLRPGKFSDCDGMTKNVSIAFGTWIERAFGGKGADDITGNSRDNVLIGNQGHDKLWGGGGSDRLAGCDGRDTISGGAGDDRLSGGAGADTFVFEGLPAARDTIIDFADGIDRIRFSSPAISGFSDLEIFGQDTSRVKVEAGGQIVIVKGEGPLHLDGSDFIFG
jgi:serralysin